MFLCHAGHITDKGVKRITLITKTRQKSYPPRYITHGDGSITQIDMGGEGWEIEKEVFSCSAHIPKDSVERMA